MRKRAGLTATKAAELIPGASKSSWTKWEGGAQKPSEYRVELFCLLHGYSYKKYCIEPRLNDEDYMTDWIRKYNSSIG